ncbi:MAG TPA: YncE family protein [Terriglobales bacterium]|nr:YncE family protein [Terriglobales bacterium]
MKLSRLAAVACAALICALISGCGDVFRPVATPLPQPAPDPQNFRLAVFTSCQLSGSSSDPNNPCSSSATSQVSDINVSGDTTEGIVPVGQAPVFALVEVSAGFVATITTADYAGDTVTRHTDTHTLTTPVTSSISPATTIGLPQGAKPISIVDVNNRLYVAESGRGKLAAIGGFPEALLNEIQVGNAPVHVSVLPSANELYVVNKGDGTVTVIATADDSVLATIAVGTSPVWAVPSADSSRVFVVNQGSGDVSVIDATSHTVIATLPVGSSPNYAVFDAKNQRVLVTNSGSNTLSVINGDPTSPSFKNVTNVNVGSNPRSVTALADGTRVYVANTGSNSVSVINSLNLAVTKTVPVGNSPVWIASDRESAKVFTANRDSQDVSVILTSSDSEVTDPSGNPQRVKAPQVDPNCTSSCARLSPLFVAIGG